MFIKMNLLKRINFREVFIRITIMAVLFILCAIAFMPKASDYSIRIQFRDEYSGYNTQLFWRNLGDEYNQEKTFMTLIEGKEAVIPFQTGMLRWNNEWRWDIIDADMDVTVTAFALYKGQENVKTFSADELEHYIINMDDIAQAYSNGTEFIVDITGEHAFINFGAWFCHAIVKHIVLRYGLMLAIVGCLIFLAVMTDKLPVMKKIYAAMWKCAENKKTAVLCYALLLLAVIFALFHDFLLGNKVFLYMGDSFYQTFAQLTHTADRIAAGDWGSGYTFFESLGNTEDAVFINLKNFCTLFGRESLAYLMGIAQMIKIFLAGIFFYGFLREMGTGRLGSSLLGMGYACNSYLIARGMWQNYPNEAVIFALWLWGFELFKNKKKGLLFFFINALCYWNYNGYSAVLYTGICLVYTVFRYASEADIQSDRKKLWRETGCALLIQFSGAFVAAAAWFPTLREMLGSSRVSQGAESAGDAGTLLYFSNPDSYRTMFYRLIGNDTMGLLDDTYAGATSWLEDPAYYCGLITVLTIPLGIYCMDKKKRRWYMIPFAGVVLYNVWGFVRYLVNGFGGAGWKLSSLWIIVLLLMTAASAWQDTDGKADRQDIKESTKGKVLVWVNVALAVLSVVLYKSGVQILYVCMSLLFVLVLSVILWRIFHTEDIGHKRYLKYLLLITVCTELICSSYRVVNNKALLNKETLDQEIYYNDQTRELLDAAEKETDTFYRVDKQFVSASYCDSLYQRYRGTASYIGGVGDNEYTQSLYEYLGLPALQHVQRGTGQNTIINTLLNVKYVLTRNQKLNTYGLELLGEDEGMKIYENIYALPFGYTYDEYITEENAGYFNVMDRRSLMLERCVINGEETDKIEGGIRENNNFDVFLNKWKDYRRSCDIEDNMISFKSIEEREIAVLHFKTRTQDTSWGNGYYMQGNVVNGRFDILISGEKEHYLECMIEGTDHIIIQTDASQRYEITEAEIYVIPKEEYFADYIRLTEDRQTDGFVVNSLEEERITGRALMEKDGIMLFTIPYAEGWTAYVNGEERELIHANIAFMGLELKRGEYDIVLEYR